MVKVAIIGAGGRMGKNLIKALQGHPQAQLVAAVEYSGFPGLGLDASVNAGLPASGILISSDLKAAVSASQVVIDFSLHEAFQGVLTEVRALGRALVVGTTGLTPEDYRLIDEAAREIAIFQANNYSIGIAILKTLVEEASKRLGPDFDIEIVETHHKMKQDAPSGTALTLAEAAAAGRGLSEPFCYGRQGITGQRPKDEIAIHALRGGDVVGEHSVNFYGTSERLSLAHSATSRMNFAVGAVRSAVWLSTKPAGRYGIDQLLVD